VGLPLPAWAQESDESGGAETQYHSPQHYNFEIKFGPYAPQVDSEFGGRATPFKDLFGDGKSLMVSGEFDVELLRKFGTLAVGGVLGYYSNTTNALVDAGSSATTPSTSTARSGSETSIMLVPLALLAIYRFDLPAERWRFPVVPFAKIGFNYTIWQISKDGNTSQFGARSGSGGTFGWQLNAGASLLLDILEPQAAKTMDVELGINHTYLFFEFAYVRADGFGSSSALRVGDTTWNAGLAFEF
jgi:hypothetical protein